MLTAPQTALGQAADTGDHRALKAALKAGADAHTVDGGTTVLHRAAFKGHTAVVKTLVGHGADVQGEDARGFFPLQLAASGDHGGTIKVLLDLGADPNQQGARGGTSLHAAAAQGFGKSVGALIRGGADVNAVDAFDATPIVYSAIHGHKKVFSALLKAGADTDRTDKTGKNVLMHLLSSAYTYRVERWRSEGTMGGVPVAYEVRDGVFTYYRNGTASYISAKNIRYISGNYCEPHMKFLDRIDLARKLLRADADLSVKDAEGWTALLYIARLQLDMIREFIKRGADVYDRTPDGRGVLHLLAMEPQRSEKDAVGALASAVKKVHKLKSLQADAQLLDALHAADDHGWTPLHYLAWRTDAREVLQPFAAFDVAANPRRKQVTGAAYRDVPAGTTAADIAVGRGLDGTSYTAS